MLRIASALIYNNQGQFLIACRASGKLAGKWEFAGGKIEPEESELDAAVCEVREELGIHVLPQMVTGIFSHTYGDQEVEMTLVECRLVDTRAVIVSDGSHRAHAWITAPEAHLYDFAPLDMQIINLLHVLNLSNR